MKNSDEDVKSIIARLNNNPLIKRYCVCSKAYDFLREDYQGLQARTNRTRKDFAELDEDVLRENNGKYADLLDELKEMEEAMTQIDARINFISCSWQFDDILSYLRNIITSYNLWENPKVAEIIDAFQIGENDEEGKGEKVSNEQIETIMQTLDSAAKNIIGVEICLPELEEPCDQYLGYEIMKKYIEEAAKVFDRKCKEIEPSEVLNNAIDNLADLGMLSSARVEMNKEGRGGEEVTND